MKKKSTRNRLRHQNHEEPESPREIEGKQCDNSCMEAGTQDSREKGRENTLRAYSMLGILING